MHFEVNCRLQGEQGDGEADLRNVYTTAAIAPFAPSPSTNAIATSAIAR